MILVFPCLLMVVDYVVVDLPKALHYCLLITGILSTSNLGIKLVHDLKTIPKIVLNSCSARLVVKHVEHLAKIHRCRIRSPISNQPEHHTICVILQLDALVHPYLP
nr:AC5 protein [Tomato severe rugose virus]